MKRKLRTSRRRKAPPPTMPPARRPFADGDWDNARNAARYASVTPDFLRRCVKLGLIPAYTLTGETSATTTTRKPRLRFRRQDLDAYLAGRRVSVAVAEKSDPPRRAIAAVS